MTQTAAAQQRERGPCIGIHQATSWRLHGEEGGAGQRVGRHAPQLPPPSTAARRQCVVPSPWPSPPCRHHHPPWRAAKSKSPITELRAPGRVMARRGPAGAAHAKRKAGLSEYRNLSGWNKLCPRYSCSAQRDLRVYNAAVEIDRGTRTSLSWTPAANLQGQEIMPPKIIGDNVAWTLRALTRAQDRFDVQLRLRPLRIDQPRLPLGLAISAPRRGRVRKLRRGSGKMAHTR